MNQYAVTVMWRRGEMEYPGTEQLEVVAADVKEARDEAKQGYGWPVVVSSVVFKRQINEIAE